MYDLKNKVALITGGAKGIGAVISSELLKEGAKHVRILDVDEAVGINLQNELNSKYGAGKSKFVKCDVTNDEQLFGAFENTKDEQGYLDVVINNAGITYEYDYAAIRKLIEVNYIALVNGALKAVEMMDKRKGGRGGTVINIASIAGLFPICPPSFIYSSTKSAILQFSACLGAEPSYEKTGVRVIALCFGTTDTSIFDKMTTFQGSREEELKAILAEHPKQSIESAARGTIEAYKKGKSASVWLVFGGKDVVEITPTLQKCHDQLANLLT